ncbi:LEMD1 isoform 11 [Pan troglodytes]|uniref:LEMD1 isoform 11 n=2 Tax=Pan troglodytes TaxID=9598 RepID=A0A6D2XZM0_PANTR|nr:LEM domain-containing protein 1 isoform X2 [Pan paniscus]PNJ00489.1 LEMD1 isoform 11 [Pan troglodytes]
MVDVKCLSDCKLQNQLEKLGFSPGPILQLNIILQGNIILSTEKSKKLKKWPEASTTKPKAVDNYCLDYKPSKGRRWAARAPSTRITYGTITKERDYCAEDQTIESWREEGFPVGLKLAVLGIFIIVVFVYLTVENKSLFG